MRTYLILALAVGALALAIGVAGSASGTGGDYCEPTFQRYSWTGGPHAGDDPPAFPSDDWQPNVMGDPHGIGQAGAYFVSHGGSGLGDWFYLELIECPPPTTVPVTTSIPDDDPPPTTVPVTTTPPTTVPDTTVPPTTVPDDPDCDCTPPVVITPPDPPPLRVVPPIVVPPIPATPVQTG